MRHTPAINELYAMLLVQEFVVHHVVYELFDTAGSSSEIDSMTMSRANS